MNVLPEPREDATPFNQTVSVELASQSRATVTFTPEQTGSEFYLPVLAISKRSDSTYKVKSGTTTIYEESEIPPTDIDDLAVTWCPAKRFTNELTVIVKNLSSSARVYHIQPLGYEQQIRRGDA